jgi:glutathione S-transferase
MMTTKSGKNTSLEIKRFINAPLERVFEAWTDPAQLKQWFGPDWVRTREIVAEAKVGGKFRWDLIDCDGKEKTIAGEYREIVLEKKIVFTWRHSDDEAWENRISIVTVEFSNRDGGTDLRLKHEQLPNEASRNDHNEGWKSVLDRLEKFVNK